MIKTEKITPIVGNYCYLDTDNYSLDAKKHFKEVKECSVCAMGGIMVGLTLRKNSLSLGELNQFDNEEEKSRKLLDIFTPMQIALIEAAFEGSYTRFSSRLARSFYNIQEEDINEKVLAKAIKFYAIYDEDSDRLKAIMKNIIENKGLFKP